MTIEYELARVDGSVKHVRPRQWRAIALLIWSLRDTFDDEGVSVVALRFADEFERECVDFDREEFLRRCEKRWEVYVVRE